MALMTVLSLAAMTECVPFLTGFTAAALPAAFGDGAVAGVADKVGSAEGNG